MAFLDIVLPIIIIVGLILAIWAIVSKQSVVDVMRDIFDFVAEKKEEGEEVAIGIYER